MGVDNLFNISPNESNYIFAGNNPVAFIDFNGNFKWPGDEKQQKIWEEKYPYITKFLKTGIIKLATSERILNSLFTNSVGALTPQKVKTDFVYGSGPVISPDDVSYEGFLKYNANNPSESVISIDIDILNDVESVLRDPKSSSLKKTVYLIRLVALILHEYTHYGDAQDGQRAIKNQNGEIVNGVGLDYSYEAWDSPNDEFEEGFQTEIDVFGQGIDKRGGYDALQAYKRRMEGKNNWNPDAPLMGKDAQKNSENVFPEVIDKSVIPTP